MLLGLAYLGVTNAFAMLRLLPMSDHGKDVEILALRHQIGVLERQLDGRRVRFDAGDRAFLAALLQGLPPEVLRRVRLLVRPDTVIFSRAATRPVPCRNAGADRAPCAPSAPWSCAWPARTRPGATGACTVNCSSSA